MIYLAVATFPRLPTYVCHVLGFEWKIRESTKEVEEMGIINKLD